MPCAPNEYEAEMVTGRKVRSDEISRKEEMVEHGARVAVGVGCRLKVLYGRTVSVWNLGEVLSVVSSGLRCMVCDVDVCNNGRLRFCVALSDLWFTLVAGCTSPP